MSMPAPLAEVVSDFAEVQGQDKLTLLLEFADDLPDLPPELEEAAMEPVPECQSPLFMHIDASDPSRVRLHFSAPAEAPTTRGFASILAAGLDEQPAGGRRFGGRAEVQPHPVWVVPIDMQKQRGLALGHGLHRRFCQISGQGRQVIGEFQQQPQLVLALEFGEVGHHLSQRCGQSHQTGTAPGLSPATIGTRTVLPHSVQEPS